MATFLTNATGRDAKEDIKGLPVSVCSHLVPGGPLARLGKGSRAGKNVARGVGAAGHLGGNMAQTLIENPDADFEDNKRAAAENFISSVGMRAAHDTARATVGGASHVLSGPGTGQGAGPATPQGSSPSAETRPGDPGFDAGLAAETGYMAPIGSGGQGDPIPRQLPAQLQPLPGSAPGTPAAGSGQPSQASPTIPGTTTSSGAPPPALPSDSGKQPSAIANNGQPPSTSPSAQPPARTLPREADNLQALDGIKRLQDKAKQGELGLDDQRELDQHEKTVAAARKYYLETEQRGYAASTRPASSIPTRPRCWLTPTGRWQGRCRARRRFPAPLRVPAAAACHQEPPPALTGSLRPRAPTPRQRSRATRTARRSRAKPEARSPVPRVAVATPAAPEAPTPPMASRRPATLPMPERRIPMPQAGMRERVRRGTMAALILRRRFSLKATATDR